MDERLASLDWMRGFVMVVMALDHASTSWNAGHLRTDSFFLYTAGMELPAAQFLSRWISHLCAPTFLFLAGTSLALSVERHRGAGVAESAIDRDILIRGLFIALLDVAYISFIWMPGQWILQVLYAIGFAMILMVPLRRLPTKEIVPSWFTVRRRCFSI